MYLLCSSKNNKDNKRKEAPKTTKKAAKKIKKDTKKLEQPLPEQNPTLPILPQPHYPPVLTQ